MSGRAGRRGIDARGTVVLLLSERLTRAECRGMMKGHSLPLTSSFRLRYNTLLKLYSMEALRPEALVAHSLHAFQAREGVTPEVPISADLRRSAPIAMLSSLSSAPRPPADLPLISRQVAAQQAALLTEATALSQPDEEPLVESGVHPVRGRRPICLPRPSGGSGRCYAPQSAA